MPLFENLETNTENEQIHEIIDGRSDRSIYKTSFAFRLLFNGKVLTPFVDGCPSDSDMCDARFLKERVDRFAHRPKDCIPRDQMEPDSGSTKEVFVEARSLVSTTEGILLVVGVMMVSAILGGMMMFA